MFKFLSPEKIDEVIVKFFKNYLLESGFNNAFIAVSGGVDSATTIYLASKILKPENIVAAFFPSEITSSESKTFFYQIIEDLKIKNFYDISIDKFIDPYIEYDKSLNNDEDKSKLRKGNITARIRMILSYDIAAKHNALVVGTENKTEYLLGYSTQWGDAAAAFHPLGDLYKTEVFKYAEFLNVPENIISRVPTAELWEGQSDEKEIGVRYEIIDKILYYLFEKKYMKEQLVNLGFGINDIEKILYLHKKSEYKRRLPMAASFNGLRD